MQMCSFIFIIVVQLCYFCLYFFFFFKQKTEYEMRISDWSSDVCSSDLPVRELGTGTVGGAGNAHVAELVDRPRVEDDELLAPDLHRLQGLRNERRRAVVVLDGFAEGLARHEDAGIYLEARFLPLAGTAGHTRAVAVADRPQRGGPPRGPEYNESS